MEVAVFACYWDDGTPVKRYQEAFKPESKYPVGRLTLEAEYFEPLQRWTKVVRLLDGKKDLIPPMIKAKVHVIKDGVMKVEGTYYDDVKEKYHSQAWRCKIIGP